MQAQLWYCRCIARTNSRADDLPASDAAFTPEVLKDTSPRPMEEGDREDRCAEHMFGIFLNVLWPRILE